jgi:hypothetical protein
MGGGEVLVILVVAATLAGSAVVFVAAFLVVYFLFFRNRVPPGPTREEMLRDLGYTPLSGQKAWSRSDQGTTMVFSEASGWKWTVRLPRYNTLTLRVEERQGGTTPDGRPFETEKPVLDRRFLFASGTPNPQTLALVSMHGVSKALSEMKYVSLQLSGDELVLTDPSRQNLGVPPNSPEAIEAERSAHLNVIMLTKALFDTLFSKLTGTIMPDFR